MRNGRNVIWAKRKALRPEMQDFSAPTTLLGRLRRHRSDDPLEVGVPARIAMDRHALRHIKFQALHVLEGPVFVKSIE